MKLDAPWNSPSGKCSKKKNKGGNTQFGLSSMTLDSVRKYSCISEGCSRDGGAALEPVSHEVFVVLGVAAVELCIVEVIFQLCFQTSR